MSGMTDKAKISSGKGGFIMLRPSMARNDR